ncbi:MAG TPA: ribosomal protein L7/L12 [Gemmata sp.]|nr:ribosomal protein L7/L12 [Gemmata sp.]
METIVLGVAGFVVGVGFVVLFSKLYLAINRLELKLDLLVRHAGLDVPKMAEEAAGILARGGKKIEAIRVYRAYTGCGLAEAKAKVESLA